MFKWLGIVFGTVGAAIRCQHDLATENLALRQQLAVMKYQRPRPRLTDADRLFWVLLSRICSDWHASLHIVKPETVVRWHRQGFRYYWRWKSCVWRIPILSHKSVQNPSLVMLVLIVTMVAQCVI